eukprot:106015-Heterocapsa_arctica.AAC.1
MVPVLLILGPMYSLFSSLLTVMRMLTSHADARKSAPIHWSIMHPHGVPHSEQHPQRVTIHGYSHTFDRLLQLRGQYFLATSKLQ